MPCIYRIKHVSMRFWLIKVSIPIFVSKMPTILKILGTNVWMFLSLFYLEKMTKNISFILSFLMSVVALSQNSNRMFKSVEDKSTHLEVVVSDGVYQIKPYSSEIIETTFIPNGETVNSQSHAVILSPEGTKTQLEASETNINYSTKDISVSIQKQPFQISYFYNDNLFISEKNGFQADEDR